MTQFAPTRRAVVTGLPLAAITGVAAAQAKVLDPGLAFVAVGDWGRDGASHQRDVARQMGKAAEEIGSRFVVAVGDNFYESGVQSVQDPQWKTSFEDVYTAKALQTPWYAILGNHDYKGVPQAQLDYARRSDRWRMPSRYYKVAGTDIGAPQADMFFLDTSPFVQKYREKAGTLIARNVQAQDVGAQLAWLDAELARSQAPWKLVFGHHTIYSGGSEHGATPELMDQVKPILERRGVQAYFNGHEHDLQHIKVGSVNYICTGAGSEVRPTASIPGTKFCLARSGFAAVRLDSEALHLEFRDFEGARVYAATLANEAVS